MMADLSLYDRPRGKANLCAKARYERTKELDYFKYSNNGRLEYTIPSIMTNHDTRVSCSFLRSWFPCRFVLHFESGICDTSSISYYHKNLPRRSSSFSPPQAALPPDRSRYHQQQLPLMYRSPHSSSSWLSPLRHL